MKLTDQRFETGGKNVDMAPPSVRKDFAILPESAMPVLRPLPETPAVRPPPAALPSTRGVFASDAASGPDLLDHAALVRPCAELLAHSGTQTPLTIGLLGAPGTGKSRALRQLLETTAAISAAAAKLPGKGPFLAPIASIEIDAASLKGDAGIAISERVFAGLSKSGDQDFSEIARLAADMAADPHDLAHRAAERLDASRRQIDTERRNLEELVGRRARLTDIVLHEMAGSPVDAFVRSRRASIEAQLRGFGFTTGDVTNNFKDLVRDLADSGGTMPEAVAYARATWAFAGQTRLIVWALVFWALAYGLGILQAPNAAWRDWLLNPTPNLVPVAGWLAQHESWLGSLRSLAVTAGFAAIGWNLWRAFRFTQPLIKGVALLKNDVETRAKDIDDRIAHQARRLEGLNQALAKHQRTASQASSLAAASDAADPMSLHAQAGGAAAGSFLSTMDALLDPASSAAARLRPAHAPKRIIVAIDNLDAVAPARALDIIDTASRVLAGKCYALAVAFDPSSHDSARLEKYVQVPVAVDRVGLTAGQGAAMMRNLLGETPGTLTQPAIDASRSMLDQPLSLAESRLLIELAPLAGRSARAIKRFANLFRLARAASPDAGAAIALALALDIGGTESEQEAMRLALTQEDGKAVVESGNGGPRLSLAVQAMHKAAGQNITGAMMQAAVRSVNCFTRR